MSYELREMRAFVEAIDSRKKAECTSISIYRNEIKIGVKAQKCKGRTVKAEVRKDNDKISLFNGKQGPTSPRTLSFDPEMGEIRRSPWEYDFPDKCSHIFPAQIIQKGTGGHLQRRCRRYQQKTNQINGCVRQSARYCSSRSSHPMIDI